MGKLILERLKDKMARFILKNIVRPPQSQKQYKHIIAAFYLN